MTRAICRRCGKPKPGHERWCSPSCRLLDQNKLKPENEPADSWEIVAKSVREPEWMKNSYGALRHAPRSSSTANETVPSA